VNLRIISELKELRSRSMVRVLERPRRELSDQAQWRAVQHLHLVEMLAWEQFEVCCRSVPLDELRGEAGYALAYGAALFDEEKGVPFGAYVTLAIRHRLVQAVTKWRRRGRLAFAHLSGLCTRTPEGEPLPFDVPCPWAREVGQEVADRELVERLERVLPPRWFELLRLYYVERYTLEEIARAIGRSRERVRQLLAKAIRRARDHCPEEADPPRRRTNDDPHRRSARTCLG
jgi:RNA polymerase sigma factor (sigma-70 family)